MTMGEGQRRYVVTVAVISGVVILMAFLAVGVALSQSPNMKETSVDPPVATQLSSQERVGLALSGGGFLAMASYTGIIVGYDQLSDTRQGSTVASLLSDSVDTISSVSGGSWFSSQLIYSDQFNNLLDRMTANTTAAADLYNNEWNQPFWNALGSDGFMGGADDKSGLAQWEAAFAFLQENGLDWQDFVGTLLNSTAGISEDDALGSTPHREWATGINWLIDHSILTQKTTLWTSKACEDSVLYNYSMPTDLDMFTPAAFSVTIGGEGDAPYPYCPRCDRSNQRLTVEADNGYFWHDYMYSHSPEGNLNSEFEKDMSSMRIRNVVAASSAFLGGLNAEGWAATQGGGALSHLDIECFTTSLAVPMCNDRGNHAFSHAKNLTHELEKLNSDPQSLLDSLASVSTRMVADGALTDNTGIAMLVANKKKVITAFIPYTVGYTPFQDLLQLFGECSSTIKDAVGVLLPVFEGGCEDIVHMINTTFTDLPVVTGAKYLDSVKYGTMNLKTIEYKPLDIQAGLEVQVNAVLLASNLNMASPHMSDYGLFVQEIIETFVKNKDKTDHVLDVLKL